MTRKQHAVKTIGQTALKIIAVAALVSIPVGGYAAFAWITNKTSSVEVITPEPGRKCVIVTGGHGGVAVDCWKVDAQ